MDALKKRLIALHDESERIWKKDDMDSRINILAAYYDASATAGDADPTDARLVKVNKVYPRVRTAMSSLFAKRPEVLVKARRVQDEEFSKNAELMLNYLVRFMHYPAEIREWLFWARLCPYGVMKLGMEKRAGMVLPMVRTVDPRSYRSDPTLDRFRPEEGEWEEFKFTRSLAMLDRSGLYPQKNLDELRDKINTTGGAEVHDESIKVFLREHYIRDGNDIIVATSANGFNEEGFNANDAVWIREEGFTKVIGLPGRVLSFIPSPRRWFPTSPVEMWLEQQKLYNGYATQKMLHAERANAKTLVDPTIFAEGEIAMLESSEPRQYVPASNSGMKGLDKAMAPVKFEPVNSDVWQGAQEADNEMQEIDGIGSVQLGRTEPERGSVSATRDQLVENAMRLRASDNQEIFEDGLEYAFQGLLNLAQKHMKGDLWIRITGDPNAMRQEVLITANEIQGDMDCFLSFSSTLPKDEESEWAKAREFYELVAANPLANQQRNLSELIKARKIRGGAEGWLAPQMPMMPPAPPGGGMPPGGEMGGMGGDMDGGFDASMLNSLAMDAVGSGQSALGAAADLRNQT